MVLGAESRIPVDFGVIELKDAVLFFDLYIHIVHTGKDFVSERPKFVFLAYVVNFVDDGSDGWVFVAENGGDKRFVGKVLLSEVKMGFEISTHVIRRRRDRDHSGDRDHIPT